MVNLFKKKDEPKVDAAEIERQEREERKKERVEGMREDVLADKDKKST